MHDIEPFFRWRNHYISAEDTQSPFYQKEYSEFTFHNRIYNYLIHPQWDDFGSTTLYCKILFADYDLSYAIIEMIGEWNDCVTNDIMYFKRNLIEPLMEAGIFKFSIIGENVLNFHPDDDDYYQEWFEEILENEGWITFINFQPHVEQEMMRFHLDNYIFMGDVFSEIDWRKNSPKLLFKKIDTFVQLPRAQRLDT